MGHTSLVLLLLALLAGLSAGRQLHQSVSVQKPLQKVRLQPQFRDWPLPPPPPCAKLAAALPALLPLTRVAGCAPAARHSAICVIMAAAGLATRLYRLLTPPLAAHTAAALLPAGASWLLQQHRAVCTHAGLCHPLQQHCQASPGGCIGGWGGLPVSQEGCHASCIPPNHQAIQRF